MLTALSTGPVGFSDAPGETDAVLIGRTCDAAGRLLQPSKPITACDSTHDAPGAAPDGFALNTYTAIGGAPWLHFLLTHQLKKPFAVRALDLYPPLAPGARFAVAAWTALAARGPVATLVAPADAHGVLITLPAVPAGTDKFMPTLTLFAPVCASGVALFGEYEKIATVSVQRFPGAAQCTPGGAEFSVAGVAGEDVGLAWYDDSTRALATARVRIGADAQPLACTLAAGGAAGSLSCA